VGSGQVNLCEPGEHIGGHVGENDPLSANLAQVGAQGLVAQVIADRLVVGIGLGGEQVRAVRRLGQGRSPLGVAGVTKAGAAQVDPQCQGRGAAGMLDLPAAHGRGAEGGRRAVRDEFGHFHSKPPLDVAGAREEGLHRLAEPIGRAWWPGDQQRHGAAGELAVKDEERQPAEVVAVQVCECDRADSSRVKSLGFEPGQAGGAAVGQHDLAISREVDASLIAPAAAERVPASHEPYFHRFIITWLPGRGFGDEQPGAEICLGRVVISWLRFGPGPC